MSKGYLISGNFLGKNVVGLTRKAMEYLLYLDDCECADKIQLIVPEDLMEYCPNLKHIKVIKGEVNSKCWNTNVAMKAAKRNNLTYVNFTSPFSLNRDSIVSIDDVRYMEKHNGEWYDSFKFRLKMYIRAKLGTMISNRIVTVSEYSKKRIIHYFKVRPEKIEVIPNGWEHIASIKSDDRILKKYYLNKNEFYFTLGSLAKHKNHKFIIDLAKNNKNKIFVVGGGVDPEIWFNGSEQKNTDNLIFTGKLSDEEIKALMQNCRAFIFPSFYEGFGIPPLEALACGAQVIVSDIEVHKEIFANSVRYINPEETKIDLDKILQQEVESPENILEKYSWKKAGEKWNELFNK